MGEQKTKTYEGKLRKKAHKQTQLEEVEIRSHKIDE